MSCKYSHLLIIVICSIIYVIFKYVINLKRKIIKTNYSKKNSEFHDYPWPEANTSTKKYMLLIASINNQIVLF